MAVPTTTDTGNARPLAEGEIDEMRAEIERYFREEYRTGEGLRCQLFYKKSVLVPVPRGSSLSGDGRRSIGTHSDPTFQETCHRAGPIDALPEDRGWWEPMRHATVDAVHFVTAEAIAVFLAHECSRYCDLAIRACWVARPQLPTQEHADRIGRSARQVERYLQQGVDEVGRFCYREQRVRWPDEAIRGAH